VAKFEYKIINYSDFIKVENSSHDLNIQESSESKKDAEKVLKDFNCNPTELPFIFVNDPAILGLGVKPGDMIRITRNSGTAGQSFYYRYVVEI